MNNGCQCKECKIKPHDSDCSVHNEPAEPKGKCDCTAINSGGWDRGGQRNQNNEGDLVDNS